jgi:hypothetical protein
LQLLLCIYFYSLANSLDALRGGYYYGSLQHSGYRSSQVYRDQGFLAAPPPFQSSNLGWGYVRTKNELGASMKIPTFLIPSYSLLAAPHIFLHSEDVPSSLTLSFCLSFAGWEARFGTELVSLHCYVGVEGALKCDWNNWNMGKPWLFHVLLHMFGTLPITTCFYRVQNMEVVCIAVMPHASRLMTSHPGTGIYQNACTKMHVTIWVWTGTHCTTWL